MILKFFLKDCLLFFSETHIYQKKTILVFEFVLIYFIVFKFFLIISQAVPEEVDLAKDEKCEFLPFCNPKKVIVNEKTGKITALEFYKTEKDENGKYYNDEDSFIR